MKNMLLRLLCFLLLTSLVSCANSQNSGEEAPQASTTHNYIIDKTDASVTAYLAPSMEKAQQLFHQYTGKAPKVINLKLIRNTKELVHHPASKLKTEAEAYLLLNRENAAVDTVAVLRTFEQKLSGATFVNLDSLGNAVSYLTGLTKLNTGKTQIKSKVAEGYKSGSKAQVLKWEELPTKQRLQLAFREDYARNGELNSATQYRYFLWLNFFYEYFKLNEPAAQGIAQRWLLDFAMIDAAEITLPSDFEIKLSRPTPLKNIFNRTKLESEFNIHSKGRNNIYLPRIDNYYAEKWKYVRLNYANHFSLENKTFLQMILVVNFLKEKYGESVIKDLIQWYRGQEEKLLLITSFFKEKYQLKLTIKALDEQYRNWLKMKDK